MPSYLKITRDLFFFLMKEGWQLVKKSCENVLLVPQYLTSQLPTCERQTGPHSSLTHKWLCAVETELNGVVTGTNRGS